MTKSELKEVVETKRRNFGRRFSRRYGVKLLGLQGHGNPQGQTFMDVEFLFNPRMTAEEIGFMCENIADWLGANLCGTVNIDFAGKPSLALVVELSGSSR